jgi:hypothetical protein
VGALERESGNEWLGVAESKRRREVEGEGAEVERGEQGERLDGRRSGVELGVGRRRRLVEESNWRKHPNQARGPSAPLFLLPPFSSSRTSPAVLSIVPSPLIASTETTSSGTPAADNTTKKVRERNGPLRSRKKRAERTKTKRASRQWQREEEGRWVQQREENRESRRGIEYGYRGGDEVSTLLFRIQSRRRKRVVAAAVAGLEGRRRVADRAAWLSRVGVRGF